MSINLMDANRQWANRPADERFWTLEELNLKLTHVKENAREAQADIKRLRVVPVGDDLKIGGDKNDSLVGITNHAFGQLCNRVEFPMGAITKVSAEIAADIINYRIEQADPDQEVQLLMDVGGECPSIRSVTSEKYARIFGAEVMPFLFGMKEAGWVVPPARPNVNNAPGTRLATEADVLANQSSGLTVKVGDPIAPAGLYAGDRDMFVFMVNTAQQIDDGTGRKWSRGFFLSNSEVGAGSIALTEFMMAEVCGNHIVWNANNIVQVRYRHVGEAYDRAMEALHQAEDKLTGDWRSLELARQLDIMRNHEIVPLSNKEGLIEILYKLRVSPVLTQKVLDAAYDAGMEYGETDGAMPNTPLGIVHGLTRYSQTIANAGDRNKLDAAGGLILDKFNKELGNNA